MNLYENVREKLDIISPTFGVQSTEQDKIIVMDISLNIYNQTLI